MLQCCSREVAAMAQPSQPSQPSRKRRKGKQECSRDLACLHDDVLLVALAFLTGAEVGRFARLSRRMHKLVREQALWAELAATEFARCNIMHPTNACVWNDPWFSKMAPQPTALIPLQPQQTQTHAQTQPQTQPTGLPPKQGPLSSSFALPDISQPIDLSKYLHADWDFGSCSPPPATHALTHAHAHAQTSTHTEERTSTTEDWGSCVPTNTQANTQTKPHQIQTHAQFRYDWRMLYRQGRAQDRMHTVRWLPCNIQWSSPHLSFIQAFGHVVIDRPRFEAQDGNFDSSGKALLIIGGWNKFQGPTNHLFCLDLVPRPVAQSPVQSPLPVRAHAQPSLFGPTAGGSAGAAAARDSASEASSRGHSPASHSPSPVSASVSVPQSQLHTHADRTVSAPASASAQAQTHTPTHTQTHTQTDVIMQTERTVSQSSHTSHTHASADAADRVSVSLSASPSPSPSVSVLVPASVSAAMSQSPEQYESLLNSPLSWSLTAPLQQTVTDAENTQGQTNTTNSRTRREDKKATAALAEERERERARRAELSKTEVGQSQLMREMQQRYAKLRAVRDRERETQKARQKEREALGQTDGQTDATMTEADTESGRRSPECLCPGSVCLCGKSLVFADKDTPSPRSASPSPTTQTALALSLSTHTQPTHTAHTALPIPLVLPPPEAGYTRTYLHAHTRGLSQSQSHSVSQSLLPYSSPDTFDPYLKTPHAYVTSSVPHSGDPFPPSYGHTCTPIATGGRAIVVLGGFMNGGYNGEIDTLMLLRVGFGEREREKRKESKTQAHTQTQTHARTHTRTAAVSPAPSPPATGALSLSFPNSPLSVSDSFLSAAADTDSFSESKTSFSAERHTEAHRETHTETDTDTDRTQIPNTGRPAPPPTFHWETPHTQGEDLGPRAYHAAAFYPRFAKASCCLSSVSHADTLKRKPTGTETETETEMQTDTDIDTETETETGTHKTTSKTDIIEGTVFIFGGNQDAHAIADLVCVDTHTWLVSRPATTGETPCARNSHSMTVANHRLFVVGGGTGHWIPEDGQDLFDAHYLDLNTMRWHACPPLPDAPGFDRRCLGRNHRAVLVGHKIVFFGGGHQDTSSLLFLDTRTLAWSCPRVTLGRPPLHRSVHGLALVGRYLLVVAGKSSGREINDMHALDLLAELEDRLPPAEAAALAASVSASASASVSPAGSTNTSRTVSVSVRGPEPASAFASTATLAAASSQTQTQAQPHTSSPRGVSDEARNSLFNWLLSRLGGS